MRWVGERESEPEEMSADGRGFHVGERSGCGGRVSVGGDTHFKERVCGAGPYWWVKVGMDGKDYLVVGVG